jgi:hypothetical protein
MPLNKAKAWVSLKGDNGPISLEKMEKLFNDELTKQNEAIMKGVEGGKLAKDQKYGEMYAKDLGILKDELEGMVKSAIVDNLDATIMETAIQGTYTEVFLTSSNPFNIKNKGEFGYFLEEKLFGLQKDSKETADFDTFRNQKLPREKRVEMKGTRALLGQGGAPEDLHVGAIQVYGLDKIDAIEMETVKHIVVIYKMMLKMQHFLYMNTEERISPTGREAIGFRAIILYTELYLQALLNWAKGLNYDYSISAKGSGSLKGDDKTGYKIHYDINIGLNAKDVLTGIKRIARLYMLRIDMINEIETGGVSAAEFFGKLRKLGGTVTVRS